MLGGTHECHPAPCTSTGDTYMKVDYPIISADSHITEAPNTYTDFIDPAWRDRAPHLVDGGDQMGDMFVVEGSAVPIPMGLVAAAGTDPSEIRNKGTCFDEPNKIGSASCGERACQLVEISGCAVSYKNKRLRLLRHRSPTNNQ